MELRASESRHGPADVGVQRVVPHGSVPGVHQSAVDHIIRGRLYHRVPVVRVSDAVVWIPNIFDAVRWWVSVVVIIVCVMDAIELIPDVATSGARVSVVD